MPASSAPYLYAAPSPYTPSSPYKGFDPKAVTRASIAARYQPLSAHHRHTGPLLDFNKHPDSYLIKPYGEMSRQPMPATTRRNVEVARKTQLVLRTLGLLGCLGALAGVVCVKNTVGIETYVIRVPPAFDILFNIYAIYHLARPARARTPASSTSYHFFATFVDVAIIPFYIYILLTDRYRLAQETTDVDRWVTLFSNPRATDIVLTEIWLASVVSAGLHVCSLAFSTFLVLMFNRISNLPPDMNPLEDNLTSIHKTTKHKYKSSDASSATSSHYTGSLVGGNGPMVKPLEDSERPLSFLQTRKAANALCTVYNPHSPATAEAPRSSFLAVAYPVESSILGARSSMGIVETPYSNLREDEEYKSGTATQHKATVSLLHAPTVPRKSSKRMSNGNWMVIEGSDDENGAFDIAREPRLPEIEEVDAHAATGRSRPIYTGLTGPNEDMYDNIDIGSAPYVPGPVANPSNGIRTYASAVGLGETWRKDYRRLGADDMLNPLALNPPTPVGWRSEASSRADSHSQMGMESPSKEASRSQQRLSVLSASRQNGQSLAQQLSGSPRAKKYGNLTEATRAIRASPRAAGKGDRSGADETKGRSEKRSKVDLRRKGSASGGWLSGASAYYKSKTPQVNPYVFDADTTPSIRGGKDDDNDWKTTQPRRVVSRSTGIDLADRPMLYDDWTELEPRTDSHSYVGSEFGGSSLSGGKRNNQLGRRHVSVKAAEEGRAGAPQQ